MTSPEPAWAPDDDFLRRSNVARLMVRLGVDGYDDLRAMWTDRPAEFWLAVADDLGVQWYERPSKVLDPDTGPWARWFPDGVTNLVLSCVDRHDPHRPAYDWEGEEGAVRTMTFGELSTLVSRIAGGLRSCGVGEGDVVGLYLPLVPEAYACLYGCAKIGAVALPLFSGFGVEPIVARLEHAAAKVLVTADGFYRRGRVVEMRRVAEEAARAVPSVTDVIVWPRLGAGNWDEFLDAEPVAEPVPVPAGHPFMLAYTSGTTGRPKGAVHVHGEFPLKMATETAYHLDQRDGDRLFWQTDLGWIMAPLTMAGAGLTGRPLLLYDGAPDHPSPARVAELLERHAVAIYGTSPTYVRTLMRRDDHGFGLDRPLSSLRVLGSTGEPWNEAPWRWYFEHVGGARCPVVNLAGGTEAGSLLGVLPIRPIKPCSFNTPCVGIDADVLGADGQPVLPREVGDLVVRGPWPGRTRSFWQDDERYLDTYWRRWPGIWVHGDWATRDDEGFWYLLGRSDDTMTVAGKRVGPAEVETVLVDHPLVTEAATVGVPHELKGQGIWCFVVASGGRELEAELRAFAGERLGRAFTPERVVVVAALPRTRNGKIVRRALRAAVTGEDPGDLSSLEDPASVDAVAASIREATTSDGA
jgi:acetyl-CoA synthetase